MNGVSPFESSGSDAGHCASFGHAIALTVASPLQDSLAAFVKNSKLFLISNQNFLGLHNERLGGLFSPLCNVARSSPEFRAISLGQILADLFWLHGNVPL